MENKDKNQDAMKNVSIECIEQDEKGIFDFSLYLFGVGLKKNTLEKNGLRIMIMRKILC